MHYLFKLEDIFVFVSSILRLNEHGVQNRHYRRIYAQKPECGGSTAMFMSATLLDTMPAFQILAWGTGGALFSFAIEIIFKRYSAIREGFIKVVKRLRSKQNK